VAVPPVAVPPDPPLLAPACAPPLPAPPPPSGALPLAPPLVLPALGVPPALEPAPPLALPEVASPPADVPAVVFEAAPSSELHAATLAKQANNVGTAQRNICVREVMAGP